jgi:hypothetical protein
LGLEAELESLIARGEDSHGCLVLPMHGEGREVSVDECEEWLAESFDQRAHRREMTTKGSFFTKSTLTLDETDYEVLDRERPDQTFSRMVGAPVRNPPRCPRTRVAHPTLPNSSSAWAASTPTVSSATRSSPPPRAA